MEDASGFTIADMLESVRQGNFDRTQVADTVDCMKESLAILEPQRQAGGVLGEAGGKAASTAISTTMAKSNSEGLLGTSQPQMAYLMEGMKDLHAKLDATLELATIMTNDLIQDFDGIQLEEQRRESKTFQVVQRLCDVMVQYTGANEDEDMHQLDIRKI